MYYFFYSIICHAAFFTYIFMVELDKVDTVTPTAKLIPFPTECKLPLLVGFAQKKEEIC